MPEFKYGLLFPGTLYSCREKWFPASCPLSPPLFGEWVYVPQHSRSIKPSRSSACLLVSLPDGLSQSLACLWGFEGSSCRSWLFLSSALISLSCHIPGCSLYTFSLPYSFYLSSFCWFFHSLLSSVSLSLSPWLPATPGLDKLARLPHLPAHL